MTYGPLENSSLRFEIHLVKNHVRVGDLRGHLLQVHEFQVDKLEYHNPD